MICIKQSDLANRETTLWIEREEALYKPGDDAATPT